MKVLTHPMLDQLAKLGLSGMTQAFAELEASGEGATLTHADWLGLLVDREITHRRDKRLAARLRYARLRHHAVVEDVDYRVHRGLDRALFHKLAAGEWIDARDNLMLCRPTGVGNSLACLCSRPQSLPRHPKNSLFAGSDAGGRCAAAMYSLVESAKLNGLNPQPYLADVLARIADHPDPQIAQLLPCNWQPAAPDRVAA
jgi:hypothetical protein